MPSDIVVPYELPIWTEDDKVMIAFSIFFFTSKIMQTMACAIFFMYNKNLISKDLFVVFY